MSEEDFDGVGDIFGDESFLVPKEPEFYSVEHERPEGKGKIILRMVKKHALWGDHLWNGGRWLANHIEANPHLIKDKSVVELGAGAGLPSLIASKLNARIVSCTDYPDRELIDNLAHNFGVNCHEAVSAGRIHVSGYLWGDDISELEKASNGSYDVLFLCDLLFNHSEHSKLLKSSLSLISPTSTAFCVFTHYRPWLAEKDLEFLFREEWKAAGWVWEKIAEERWELMFEADRGDAEVRRTVHAYQLNRIRSE
jgi:EEF1A N-terminal glycine/lysine methyltransferase